jgi:hypothetical protein
MTGVQLVLAFAAVISVAGLALLVWGKDRGSGTIKFLGLNWRGVRLC